MWETIGEIAKKVGSDVVEEVLGQTGDPMNTSNEQILKVVSEMGERMKELKEKLDETARIANDKSPLS